MVASDQLIKLIAFDADDTLWHSEHFYQETGKRFIEIVRRYRQMGDEALQKALYGAETRNLSLFGYGAKGLTLSMIETALEITDHEIDGPGIQEILSMGKELLRHPVNLLPGVEDVLTALAARYELVLITKGDLFHQETKIAQANVADFFSQIEIVSEKDSTIYTRLLKARAIEAHSFVMIGNSLRSDIEPVLGLGGWGIHIPYEVTWAHETIVRGDVQRDTLRTLSGISEVPYALTEIENSLRAQRSAFHR